jgi:hypothetical protein
MEINNPRSNSPETEEADIVQCACNTMGFDASLKALLQPAGNTECTTFIV